MSKPSQPQFARGSVDLYGNKAEIYARCRPDFAPEAITKFLEVSKLPEDTTVADIGAGTGMLTRHLLNHFETVYAIEPNADMRRVAEQTLGKYPGFHSINSPAEKINLPDHSVNLITVGQALHWFDPKAALTEFQRIAQPDSWLLAAHIKSLDEKLNEALKSLWTEENGCIPKASQPRAFNITFSDFFVDGEFQRCEFSYTHEENWESFLGGLISASFAPNEDHPLFKNFKRVAREIFEQHRHGEILTWNIATEIWFGILPESTTIPQ